MLLFPTEVGTLIHTLRNYIDFFVERTIHFNVEMIPPLASVLRLMNLV